MFVRLIALALGLCAMFAPAIAESPDLATLARAAGTPEIPGLKIVWLAPWGDVSKANAWRNIIVHQTEGGAGSAKYGAMQQAKNPTRRGVTVWVETDGTVYWAVPEDAIPTHGDGANRNDNKYIDNGCDVPSGAEEQFDRRGIRRQFSRCGETCERGTDRGVAHSRARAAGALWHPQ